MGLLGRIISLVTSGPAIQNLDRVDMQIDYKDGGVLLLIIVSQHLDGSDEVNQLVREKLITYLGFLDTGELADAASVEVEFKCVKKPDAASLEVIDQFRSDFESRGARLSWKS